MGKRDKNRKQFYSQTHLNSDKEIATILEQQRQQHQASQNSVQRHRRPQSWIIAVLLENGHSFEGTAVAFDDPRMPKCKIFFKDSNKREFCIAVDIDIHSMEPEKLSVIQSTINNYLEQLYEESLMEFPRWLEKFSTRTGEANPFFNLDEIREEFNYKKSRFGAWRNAAQTGFFTELRPQTATINKIVHLEIREQIKDQPN
jgi:hypothetical protein